jgi:hypothetical protein
MTFRRKSGLALASALLGAILAEPAAAAAAPTVDCGGTNLCIDLAGGSREQKSPITPGSYTVKILNMIPGKRYRLTVDNEPYQLFPSPFSVPTGGAPKPAMADVLQDAAEQAQAACETELEKLKTKYNDADSEARIRELNSDLPSQLTTCDAAWAASKRQQLLDGTTEVKTPLKVEEYTQLIVKVELLESEATNAKVERTFGPYTFSTPRPPGQWLIYYGFNYIWQNNEEYFAKPNPNTTPQTYTVTAQSDVGGSSFSPSLYFMWFSADQAFDEGCFLSCSSMDRFRGVTAGIGFDFDNPTLFIGYGLGWGYNVMLNAGVAMSKVTRLAGRYRKGDVVNEPLTDSQLSEETYEPYGYIGAAFRFGASPWESSKAPPAPPAPTTETAKPD